MTSSVRQRTRRAFQRLSLSEAQAEKVRQHLRDDRRQWAAAQQLLAECRRHLGEALATPTPDSAAVLELAVQERLLEDRARALSAHLEERMAGLLRPDQALRLRALGPAVLGDVLGRLCA
jgi:Spy/CpxP family protein refolding chaperone